MPNDFLATLLAAFFDYYAAPLAGSGLTTDLDRLHVSLSFHSDAKAAVTNHHASARRRALLNYGAALARGFLHDIEIRQSGADKCHGQSRACKDCLHGFLLPKAMPFNEA
jgi:hypothetical protein